MHILRILLIIFLLKLTTFAQEQNRYDTIGLFLDFSITDFPYQYYATKTTGNFISSYANPSMQQSLTISSNFYNSIYYGLKKLIKKK